LSAAGGWTRYGGSTIGFRAVMSSHSTFGGHASGSTIPLYKASLPGMAFETAWANREEAQVEGLVILFISKAGLIKTKEASARDQDLIDVKKLRRAGGP
jgi:hypothetical protein